MASISDEVRQYVMSAIIEPARRRGVETVEVNAGEVERALGLSGRHLTPTVCAALKAKTKFLQPHGLHIERVSGPPSGQSPTVTITFRLGAGAASPAPDWFESLHGLLRGMFEAEGGAEAFLRNERAAYNGPGQKS